ncbi:SxtJ family membrane protein [Rubrivirga sp. IMCC43871]|uniref:SxtJ family membrane protein n=1 Tax=Rubrivirga sp. IMCC43871 TaxID=3391575 RepID=UPI00398FFEFB
MADDAPRFLETVRDEVRALDPSRRALRRFGWTVGGVFVAIAGVVWWRSDLGPWVSGLGGLGGALVILGTVAPGALRGVRRVWMALAFALGFVMTRVLLTVVFVAIVVPTGLTLRAFGRDPLTRRPDASAATYWVDRADGRPDRESLERFF